MLRLEVHQSCRPDTVDRCIEEDQATLVLYTCHLPGSHTPRLVALVGDGVGDDDGTVLLIDGEGLPHPTLQTFRHLAGHAQRRAVLFHGVRVLVELFDRRPVPLFLRTGPERAAESLGPSELRDDLTVVVLEREDFSALGGIDSHRQVTVFQVILTCLVILLRCCQSTSASDGGNHEE